MSTKPDMPVRARTGSRAGRYIAGAALLIAALAFVMHHWRHSSRSPELPNQDVLRTWMAQAARGQVPAMAQGLPPAPGIPHAPGMPGMSGLQGLPATVRVLDDTPKGVRLVLILPQGETIEETLSFEPDVDYRPTPSELAGLQSPERQVFGARLTQVADASGARMELRYVVPTQRLPPELRARLSTPSQASSLHLIEEASAQPAMNLWTGIAAGYANKVSTPGGDLLKVYKNYEKVEGALDISDQYSQWMEQFDAMEACARNPTHQVTQDAYRDNPQYQQQTLDAIAQARSEATQATALSFLNQETSTAMQLTEAPALLKDATKSVAKWNDAALRDIGNGSVHDAGGLVDCDLAPPPNRHAGDGTLTYRMHREGWQGMYVSEDHLLTLDVTVAPGPAGAFELRGQGDLKSKIVSKQEVGNVECIGTSAARGAGYGGHVEIHGGPASGQCGPDHKIYTSVYHTDIFHSDNAFDCTFDGIDPVNGGSHDVAAIGEEAPYARCSLELKPRQK